MLLPSNAWAFARYSAASICSSDTPSGLIWLAIFPSVSPRFTGPYELPPTAGGVDAAVAAVAAVAAGTGRGAGAAAVGAGAARIWAGIAAVGSTAVVAAKPGGSS